MKVEQKITQLLELDEQDIENLVCALSAAAAFFPCGDGYSAETMMKQLIAPERANEMIRNKKNCWKLVSIGTPIAETKKDTRIEPCQCQSCKWWTINPKESWAWGICSNASIKFNLSIETLQQTYYDLDKLILKTKNLFGCLCFEQKIGEKT